MTQDEQYLDLLAIFHYVVGAMTAFFSCFLFLYLAMGIAMLLGAFDGKEAPPKVLGWFFIVFPSLFIIAAWTAAGFVIAAGRSLSRRTSRTFCLIVAGAECFLVPFGTILGVFTIVMLTKESVKQRFAANNGVNGNPVSSPSP